MTTGSTRFLIDSKLLIYPYNKENEIKQRKAIDLVGFLIEADRAAVSVQCLSEFYRVVTTRLAERMIPAEAFKRIEHVAEYCEVLDIKKEVLLEGCRGGVLHHISIWDALIWAAAKLNQIPYILTEDSRHDRPLENVRYLNPFTDEFSLQDYLGKDFTA